MFSNIILPIIVAVCIWAVCVGAVLWYSQRTVQESPPEAHVRCVVGLTQDGEQAVLLSQLIIQIASLTSPDGRNLLSPEIGASRSLLPLPDGAGKQRQVKCEFPFRSSEISNI